MQDKFKNIQILFRSNPQLKELIPNPNCITSLPLNLPIIPDLNLMGNEGTNDFYKLVFKKGSSKNLMMIKEGELEGLLTTSCIEKGKISDVAGLERINIDINASLMMALLGVSIYGAIRAELLYISKLCHDIRNHQIIQENAKFERITESIVDSFLAIPDISFDPSIKGVYLSNIVTSREDCYELFVAKRIEFATLLKNTSRSNSIADVVRATSNFLKDPVFAVFERLVGARICEIVISGNYSKSHIQRHKNAMLKAKKMLEELMCSPLNQLNDITESIKRQSQNLSIDGYEKQRLESELSSHIEAVDSIKMQLFELLDKKLEGFDILERLAHQDQIEVFLIDGVLIIDKEMTK